MITQPYRRIPAAWVQPRAILVFAALLALCFIVDFLHVGNHGYMADDWGRISYHLHPVPHLERYGIPHPIAVALKLARFDGRPLLAVTLLVERGCHELGGRVLWSLVGCAILALNAFLMFKICERQLPWLLAFCAAVLVLLFPGDTTRQWLTLACGRIAFTLALLACLAFASSRRVVAFGLLVATLFLYEPAVLLFFLAPWCVSRGHWRDIRRAVVTLGAALAAWMPIRVALYLAGERGYGAKNITMLFQTFLDAERLGHYLLSFPESLAVGFVVWPREALRLAVAAPNSAFIVLSAVAVLGGLAAHHVFARGQLAPSPMPFQNGAVGPNKSIAPAAREAAAGFVAGIFLTVASALPSMILGVTSQWGIYTRGNIVLGFGVALALASAFGMAWHVSSSLAVRRLAIVALMVLMSAWAIARYEIQKMFVEQIRCERRHILRLADKLGSIPRGTLLVVASARGSPPRRVVRPISHAQKWEYGGLFRALYGANIFVFSADEPWQDMVEQHPDRNCGVMYVDLRTVETQWLRPPVSSDVPGIPPTPSVMEYLRDAN